MTKLNKEKIQQCEDWIEENGLIDYGGATQRAFCKAVDIGTSTHHEWMKVSSEYREAIKRGKDKFKQRLASEIVVSLSKAAKGFEYEKKREEVNAIGVTTKKVTETVVVQPNVAAGIFLLTNLDPEHYQNKQHNEVIGNLNVKEEPIEISDELLAEIADKIQNERKAKES